ncbi:hypothetical protein L1887_34171 [Cichorium endivia]|nr:hypothetical protein L1887_34171 [Cichorium endivia]
MIFTRNNNSLKKCISQYFNLFGPGLLFLVFFVPGKYLVTTFVVLFNLKLRDAFDNLVLLYHSATLLQGRSSSACISCKTSASGDGAARWKNSLPADRWMSATVSGRSRSILIKVRNSLISNTAFALLPKAPIFQCSHCCNISSSSNRKYDSLEDFSPLKNLTSEDAVINLNERRSIVLGLGKMIKKKQGFILKDFSCDFCPFLLVKIMTQFGNRQGAFAFFKFVFREESDRIVKSCCVACHVLAMQGFRIIAQDVLSWMIGRIGLSRGQEVMESMWRGHFNYESDFSVLDSLMRAFMKVGMDSQALEISGRMRGLGLQPCLSALTILFRLLLRIGDYGSVWKLFRDMIRKGPHPSNITFNVMINEFCRKGQVQTGESLLHIMRKFHCEPDVYTYNILINAYCIHGQTLNAWSWVELMKEKGCTPSTATFSTIINAFSKEGNIKDAKKTFDQMQVMGVTPNSSVYNALMDGFVKAKEIDKATNLLEEMKNNHVKADGVTFNILVAGYYKYERTANLDHWLEYINQSMSKLLPDDSLPDVSVARLCLEGKPDEATKLLEDMLKKGLPLSVISFNSIISAYSKKRLETKAFEAYHMMIKYGVTPSSSTCNSLLMCLSRNGKLLEAEELMCNMKERDFPVNKVAFTVIIDGYFKIGDVMGAQRLWAFMENISTSPDTVAFSAYIDGLSKTGLVEEANRVYGERNISAVKMIDSGSMNTTYDCPSKLDFDDVIFMVVYRGGRGDGSDVQVKIDSYIFNYKISESLCCTKHNLQSVLPWKSFMRLLEEMIF